MAAIFSADEPVPEKGLVKGTNWWGAFVIDNPLAKGH